MSPQKLFIISALAGVMFFFIVNFNVLAYVPGFHCEGFGCAGAGIFYIALGCLMPAIIALTLALRAEKGQRSYAFFRSLLTSGTAIAIAVMGIQVCARIRVSEGEMQRQQACLEYPQLCPDEGK